MGQLLLQGALLRVLCVDELDPNLAAALPEVAFSRWLPSSKELMGLACVTIVRNTSLACSRVFT